MSAHAEPTIDRQALDAELLAARARCTQLGRELSQLDASLDELAGEREQHALVQTACSALEKLRELGGEQLFWGERGDRDGDFHLGAVRRRVDEFERRIGEIEAARRTVLARLRSAEFDTEVLEEEADEARREAELRKLDWLVERELGPLPALDPVMPWTRSGEDDRRFRKSLAISLLLSLLLAVLLPLIELPVPERWQPVEVSERFTRLIEEPEPAPPPPVLAEKKLEELVPEAAEEPQVVEEKPAPEPTAVAEKPKAGAQGILAFREKFSTIAESSAASRLGAKARIDRSGDAAIGQRGRSLVAIQAPGSSGGIDVGSLGRDAVGGGGGGSIEGVEIGRATSSIGGTGTADRPLAGGPGPGRTDEEIQIVFDRHKAALYRLYNRELRRDPTLQGQIVLRLTIEPDGSVSLCEVNRSDMAAPELAAQVAMRVKGFDFGAKEGIGALTILYPIDFLPAT